MSNPIPGSGSGSPESLGSNVESETWSLDSSFKETVVINGRTYQQLALERGTTYTPVDDFEREMLDRHHRLLQLVFDQRLIFPPVENPSHILDCGYGSGAWAVEVAEKYPGCQVIGVDISPHMRPEEIPRNLWLQVDDLNEPFTFQRDEFDLVHSRLVVNGIDKSRWRSYIADCIRVTKPGGWVQFVEMYHNIQSDNGTISDDHAIRRLGDQYVGVMEDKKDLRAPMHLEGMLVEAGMVEVGSRMIQLPVNGWSNNPRDREIGERFNRPYKESIASHVSYLFSEVLDMTLTEVHAWIARARQDADNTALKPYVELFVVIGRKPNS